MSNLAPDLTYEYFAFQYSGLKAEASSDHFQLRHLAVASTAHDIYYAGTVITSQKDAACFASNM